MKSLYTTRAAARRMAIVFVCAVQFSTSLSALDYYWVNGSGAWSQFATHWAKIPNPTLPAHYHANVPTADDDVYFGDTNGGTAYTVNVDAGSTVPKCRNMDWTGVPAGTVWGGGGGRMDIYGSLTMDPNLTMTFNNEIHLISNDAAMKQIWSKTVHFSGTVYFEGTGGGWQLMDDFYVVDAIHHVGGLLETMGKTVTVFQNYFYGNVDAGSSGQLHLGSSEVIFSNGGGQFKYNSGQFDAGTSHIKLYGNAGSLNGGAYYAGYPPSHFYNVSFYGNLGNINGGYAGDHIDGTLTFYQRGAIYSYNGNVPVLNNVFFLGDCYIHDAQSYNHLTLTAGKTYTVQNYQGTNGTDQTILPGGTLTALGAGTCSQFITIKSWQYGTHFNFVNNSGVKQTVHCAILEDCHATGSDPLEVLDGVDLGNNTGWIFTLPNPGLDLYWVGGGGDWNDPAHWSETDGGVPGACLPNGASNVHFTALSGFSPGDVVNVAEDAYCLNMDWTGVTGEPKMKFNVNVNLHIYGSMTLAPPAAMFLVYYGDYSNRIRFRGSGTHTVTTAGQFLDHYTIFEGTGMYAFADAFNTKGGVVHLNGQLKTMGFPVSLKTWDVNMNQGTFTGNPNTEVWFGDPDLGISSTLTFSNAYYPAEGVFFNNDYSAGKFHAMHSHLVLQAGPGNRIMTRHSPALHDYWKVTFPAGTFERGNILDKLTFTSRGNIDTYGDFNEVEFYENAVIRGNHSYNILTIRGGYFYQILNYNSGENIQTINAGGTINVLNADCERLVYLNSGDPVTTAKIAKIGGALHLQHVILDNVLPDLTTGATYSAMNSFGIQPQVTVDWNMTNPAPRNLFWVGGSGIWHDSNHWSLASGGAGGECPPTPEDNVRFDAASSLGAGSVVDVTQIRAFCKDMDWTGVTGGAKFYTVLPPYTPNQMTVFGSLTFSAGMENDFAGSFWMRATGAATITSAGNHFKNSLNFWEPAGDWYFADALWVEGSFNHDYGKIRTNDFPVTIEAWWDARNNPSIGNTEVFLGNSTVTLKGTNDNPWALLSYAPDKFHSGTSTLIFDTPVTGYYGRLFSNVELYDVVFETRGALQGSKIKNKLIYKDYGSTEYASIDDYIHEVEFQGDADIFDSRSYHSMKFAPGKRYTFTAGYTQTIVPHNGVEGQFIAQGLPGQYIEMKSSNPSVPAIIQKDDYDNTSTCTKYLFLTGMTHTGTGEPNTVKEDIYVPTPGGDVFNNAGWQFFPCNPCPATIPVLDVANSITTGCPPGQAKLVLAGLKPDEWAIWYTDPAATTNLVYNGGTPSPAGNMFMPTITGPVTYYARVYSDGGLCESTVVLAVDITITAPPAAFNVTGGGTVCAGSNGTPVGLDGSVAGVTYQLQRDGSDTGSPLSGTGAALDFGLQTAAGTYTVVATTDGTACSAVMGGSAVVIGDPNAAPAVAASSNAPLCTGSGDLLLFESGGAATSWSWSGPGGFASADQNPVIPNPTPANDGTYWVVVSDGLGCTNVGSVAVLITTGPTMDIPASQELCAGETTAPVSFVSQPDVVFLWTNDNPSIGLPANGIGTIADFIAQNNTGSPITATITVTPQLGGDIQNPAIACLNGVSFNIMQGGMVTRLASTFIDHAQDNCTPVNDLVFSIIKSVESTGIFPTDGQGNPLNSVTFDCSELGIQTLQLWVRDLVGNVDYCEFYVVVNDNQGYCGQAPKPADAIPAPPTNKPAPIAVNSAKSAHNFDCTACIGTPVNFTITVYPTPTVDKPGDVDVCNGFTVSMPGFVGSIPGTVFTWSNDNPAIGLAANGIGDIPAFAALNPGAAPITAMITVVPTITFGSVTCTGVAESFLITVYPQPDATITTSAAAQVCPGTTGYTASVPDAGPGATYTWTILNGTITDGQGTNSITYNVDGVGQTVLSVTVVGAGGCSAAGCNNTFIQSLGNMGGSQPNIFPHPNGDFFATGLRNDSMVIVRFDPLGTPLWARAFVLGTNTLLIRDMLVDASGDLIGVAYYETGKAADAKSTVFRYNIATHSFVWVQHISAVLFTNIHDFDAGNCVLTGTGNGGYTQLAHIDKSTGAISTYALQGEGGDYYSVMQNGHLYGACRRYYTTNTDLRASVFSHDAATGAFEWQNSLISEGNANGGPNFTRMYPEKPAIDNDSLVVLASGDLVGFDLYLDGPTDLVVAKTDLTGNVGWTKQYLVSGYDRPVATRIANTADGYYIVANMYLPGLSNFGFGVLIKTDKQGTVQWAKRLGISGKNIVKNILERNGFLHLMIASDSYAPNELLLLKLDLQGNSSIACDFIQPIVVSAITMMNIQNARPYTVSNRVNTLTPLVETPNSTPLSNVERCGTPCSNSLVVHVALPDAGNIAGPFEICSGNGFQYTSSGVAGGLWSSDDPGVAYVDANTGDVFALAPGFCAITYTVTENGCTNTAYFFLEVLSSPYVEAISNSPVCAGGDAVLAEIGGDAASWYWYDPNGFPVSNAQTFSIPNVSPADEGLYVVAAYAANGCVGYAQTPVFLSGPASAGTISGSATVCQGKNTPLSIIGTPGGTWSSSNTAIATVNSVSGLVQGVAPGMVVITYTVSVNGCTETADFNIEVKPRPAVDISGVRGVCENETLVLTETGGDAVSWVWSNGFGFVTTDQTLTFFNPLYAVFGGFANVVVTDASGCTNSMTVDAGARPLPDVLASSNAPLCAGSGPLELFETGGAQGVTWAWSGPGGYQSMVQNPVIANPTAANSGDYTVVVTDTWNGCTNSQTVNVLVSSAPAPVLDPLSVLVVQQGQQATLILQNLPPGYEAVWYAADQTTVLYADAANMFQPVMHQGTTFYGAVREIASGCVSGVLEVKVGAYPPLTIRIENCAVTCADGADGMATAVVRGGEQSKGAGNFVLSDERYGFSGLKTTTADFNGDGTLDIYATSGIAGSVFHDQVWLNRGDGTFEYQFVEYNSTKQGWRPESGDLDGDGDIDVVVISGSSTLIMLNNGAGYFTETVLAGFGGFGISLGDLDNDQDLDVLIGGIGHCYVFYNDGNANFTQHPTNYTPANTVVLSIQTGDLNNDGWMDAWLAMGDALPAGTPDIVLINDQTGVLTVSPESYGNYYSADVVLGDLNGDQYLDAFVATYYNAPDKVYLNDGDGTFTEAVQGYSNYSTDAVVLADFDADGDLDAATSFAGTTAPIGLEIWTNDGTGVFTKYPVEFPNGNDLAVGDFDCDGDIDLFVTNQGPTTGHYVLLNDDRAVVPYTYQWDAGTGSQTTAVATGLSAGSYTVTVTDAAGTAVVATAVITANPAISLSTTNTDASCATAMDGTASVMATGGAPFSFVVGGSVPAYAVIGPRLALGDVNGDGQKDVVFLDETGYKVALQNGGNGFDVQPTVLSTDGLDVVLVDLNNDGDLDAVIAGYFIRVFHNDGNGNFTEVPESYTLCGQVSHCYANGIDAGDLDGDGDIDLFVVNGLNGPCTVWLNDGDGTFTESAERYGSEDGRDVQLGDLDGDGDLDAFVANQGHPDVVYLNDGDGTFTRSQESYSNLVSASVDLGDLDGDGDLDAFVGTDLGQNDRMLLNNGDGTFILTPEQLKSTNNSDVELADLDGDGDLDVYTTSSIIPGETCKVWLNNGNGTFAELPQEFPRAAYIQFDDLDGDGDLDAVYTFRGNLFWAFNVQNFTYLWSTGATTEMISGIAPGPYTVIVTDASGCTAEETVVVGNAGNLPPVLASSNAPLCAGSGPLQLFETGGAQGVTWAWSNPGGYQAADQNPVIPNPTPANSGDYTVVVTDDWTGCTNSAMVYVEIKPRPAAAISGNDEICENEPLILTETGGEGVSWEWYSGTGWIGSGQILNYPNPTNAEFNGVAYVIVTGANGCTNSALVDVIVYDAPEAICPPDITICASELPLDLSTLGALQVGGTFSGPGVNGAWFDAAPGATYPVTYTVTNANSCSEYCMFSITVRAAPPVTCPPNSSTCLIAGPLVLSGGAPGGGTYSGPGVNAGVFDPAAAGVGPHTIGYAVLADPLCPSTCSFTITVVPGLLPAITCPGPVTVPCAGNIPAPNPGLVFLSGGCGAATVDHLFTSLPYDVDCLNRFKVTRYYQATDASNNTVSCSQVITVFDDTKPNFTFVPANVTVQCNSLPAVGMPTASDNCGGPVNVAYNGQTVSGQTCTDAYVLTRQWTATDLCGNTRTATQRIAVIDTQKPNFVNPPANITVQCDAIPTATAPAATDNCDAAVAITYVGQTKTNGTCANAYTLTRRWVASDNCNNTVSISQRITVVDNGKPTLSIPANTTIACNAAVPPVGTATATDGCGGNVTIAYLGQTTANASCPGTYQIRRTWRATDACGNSTAATQTIQVADNSVPIFTSVPVSTTISCTQSPPPLNNPVATDNCGGYVQITYLGQVRTDGNGPDNYDLTRTWRATDLCGNSVTAVQVIAVRDTEAPVFTNPPADLTVVCAPNCVPQPTTPNAIDNCSTPTVTLQETQSPGDCSTGYTVTRTWTATDACGNVVMHTQTITVLPAPTFSPPANDRAGQLKTQNPKLKTLNLLPNPTTDQVWIDLGDFAGETVRVSIHNDLGQLIWERRVEVVADLKLPVRLREAGAAAGLYTVSVRSGGLVVSGRLVLVE